jgi:hypothetical protein
LDILLFTLQMIIAGKSGQVLHWLNAQIFTVSFLEIDIKISPLK